VFVSKQGEVFTKNKMGEKQYHANEAELEAAMPRKRESVRTFMRRYARPL